MALFGASFAMFITIFLLEWMDVGTGGFPGTPVDGPDSQIRQFNR